MKLAHILVVLAASASVNTLAARAAAEQLARVSVDRTPVGEVVVSYEPRLAKLINETFTVPEAEIKTVEVLRTRLGDSSEWYRVVYSEGPSVDPEFIIYAETGGKQIEVFREFGLSLRLPGDGFVYVSGHTNDFFDKKRKFAVSREGSSEVKQPFYFVGITTTAREGLDLVDSPGSSSVVATVARGEQVTVVLNQGDFYLVRASDGLVGWVRLKQDGTATQFEGIHYAGD
ncbi:MAG: SH3 domain-containing protein [Thermoanaerobaculia bacterium]|nr:SH3 domain-containing protein [Thermoanaerobaculia bacterium]